MARSTFSYRAKRLRELLVDARQAAGLTQVELSKRLRRPQSYVSKYERGERRLDVVEFMEVCDAVGADAAALLRGAAEVTRALS